MMIVSLTEFLAELANSGIEVVYELGRIKLVGGKANAREHYTEMLKNSPEFEGALVWKLAQTEAYVMDWIEERRAIIWSETGDGSIRTAIMSSITG